MRVQPATTAKQTTRGAFARHRAVFERTTALEPDIAAGAELLAKTIRRGNCVFFCGNGGSAADSQHFAAELTCRYRDDRRPLPGVALTVDTSALTAIGNDYRFEDVFSRQMTALGRRGDLLVAFSTSGRSKNVLRAMRAARAKGMKVIFMTGAGGSSAGRRGGATLTIAVPDAETARIQELHELICHTWFEYLDLALRARVRP